jgi:hypothetical protein
MARWWSDCRSLTLKIKPLGDTAHQTKGTEPNIKGLTKFTMASHTELYSNYLNYLEMNGCKKIIAAFQIF